MTSRKYVHVRPDLLYGYLRTIHSVFLRKATIKNTIMIALLNWAMNLCLYYTLSESM